jgi:hypothetical protein
MENDELYREGEATNIKIGVVDLDDGTQRVVLALVHELYGTIHCVLTAEEAGALSRSVQKASDVAAGAAPAPERTVCLRRP